MTKFWKIMFFLVVIRQISYQGLFSDFLRPQKCCICDALHAEQGAKVTPSVWSFSYFLGLKCKHSRDPFSKYEMQTFDRVASFPLRWTMCTDWKHFNAKVIIECIWKSQFVEKYLALDYKRKIFLLERDDGIEGVRPNTWQGQLIWDEKRKKRNES